MILNFIKNFLDSFNFNPMIFDSYLILAYNNLSHSQFPILPNIINFYKIY